MNKARKNLPERTDHGKLRETFLFWAFPPSAHLQRPTLGALFRLFRGKEGRADDTGVAAQGAGHDAGVLFRIGGAVFLALHLGAQGPQQRFPLVGDAAAQGYDLGKKDIHQVGDPHPQIPDVLRNHPGGCRISGLLPGKGRAAIYAALFPGDAVQGAVRVGRHSRLRPAYQCRGGGIGLPAAPAAAGAGETLIVDAGMPHLAGHTVAAVENLAVVDDSGADAGAQASIARSNVDIRYYRVIYDAIDEIESAMKGMLAPKYEEVVIGHAEVRMTYKVSAIGTIAGCMVKDGKVTRDSKVRILRDHIVIHEGEIGSLQRFKDAAKEVTAGYECGMSVVKFNDIREGDIFECYVMQEIKR